jgi:hypothetical protein
MVNKLTKTFLILAIYFLSIHAEETTPAEGTAETTPAEGAAETTPAEGVAETPETPPDPVEEVKDPNACEDGKWRNGEICTKCLSSCKTCDNLEGCTSCADDKYFH